MTTIRQATNNDAKAISALFLASRMHVVNRSHLRTEEETGKFIAELVGHKEVWVAEEKGRIVGFAVISEGWLEHFYVQPNHFNSGAGAMLFEKLATQHPQGFQFWVFQQNEVARRFYEQQGCVVLRLTDGEDNEEKQPDALYVWRKN